LARLEGDSSNRLFDILTEWEALLQHLPEDDINALLADNRADLWEPSP
jgi:predicted Abi (CAAX) family protease